MVACEKCFAYHPRLTFIYMTIRNRQRILWTPLVIRSTSVYFFKRTLATTRHLLHAGLCPQQHADGQGAHCLWAFGSRNIDAVSLILNSWTLKRGKNHQKSFLASWSCTQLKKKTYLHCKHIRKEKPYSLPPQGPSILWHWSCCS